MCALVETDPGRDSIDEAGHQTSRNDLKTALRQADKRQNALRKTRTWHSERTAFEPPEPQAIPKQKGVRSAIRRQTRKLKRTTSPRPPTATDIRPPSLYRSDSFDYGDELKRRQTVRFAPSAITVPHPGDAQSDTKTQLLNLKAQQQLRRAQQKEAEKRTKEQEKAQRRALTRQVKQEKILEYLSAFASRHPRQNLKRIRYRQEEVKVEHLAQQQHVPLQRSYYHTPISPESWLSRISASSRDLVSPIASQTSRQSYTYSPGSVPRWFDFSSKDELLSHLSGRREQRNGSYHSPQELPAYERLSAPEQKVEPVEVSTDLPDRELQTCKAKPNLVYCDICAATVSLSGVFYSCTICGPREGGIVCSGCHQENKKCHGGLHSLESSMQVVQRVSPSSWRSHESSVKASGTNSNASETVEDSAILSRINADTASHSLCLATMQKRMAKLEASIESHSKTTERLAAWLEVAMESQREQAAELTRSLLDEFSAERNANMNTIKQLSTKRKPRRQASEGSNQIVPVSQNSLRQREMALRERESTLREREMCLEERRQAAEERAEKVTPTGNPLPSQSLASAPNQENRMLLDVLNRLNRIEDSAMSSRQAPEFNEKTIEQVVVRAIGDLKLGTSGFQEHTGVKRKTDSTGTIGSIQSTPTTDLSSASFLQLPARKMSRGNQDDDDDEGDGHSPKRPKNQPAPVPESGKRLLLACPFTKMDFNRYSHRNVNELNYRGCSSCVLTDISRLKQHLYRVHQVPEFHCPRCFDDLLSKEQLNTHLREGCEARVCPYPEKFSDSSKLKKKWPRKSMTECWYMVFKILFPGHRLPASPYAEDLATGGIAIGAPSTPPQPVPTFSLSPDVVSAVVARQLERHCITDPDQHAFLLSLVQDATTEALGLISASPTPITNSNPSSALPQSGTYATSPGPESALARHDDAVDPNLLSKGTGTMDSTFGAMRNLQDLSSLGSGVNAVVSLPGPPSAVPAMSSNQSLGTFSGLSPLPGTENLMDFDDDLVQLTSNEMMTPIKPSNSTRTIDSGYGSILRNDGVFNCYPSGGDGPGTSRSSGTGNRSEDSLFDPETYGRLLREHGDDFLPFGGNIELGPGGAGSLFGA